MNLLEQLAFNPTPGPDYRADDPRRTAVVGSPVRLLAFYLPQFHPIPENDAW